MDLVESEWLEYMPVSRRVLLPDELYLRDLMRLDLEDPTQVHGFVQRWGRLERPELGHPGEYRDLPVHPGPDVVDRVEARAREKRALLGLPFPTLGEDWGVRRFSHISEATAHMAALRDCVRVWHALGSGGIEFDPGPDWDEPRLFPRPSDRRGAVTLLKDLLNPALREFGPNIRLEGEPSHGARIEAPLYSGLALQLFTHIRERARYSTCRNERCRNLFVRQQGRAQSARHHRQGVMYCSDNCARAVAARAYRRRHREADQGLATTEDGKREEAPPGRPDGHS